LGAWVDLLHEKEKAPITEIGAHLVGRFVLAKDAITLVATGALHTDDLLG
jgi:hypothetical protein